MKEGDKKERGPVAEIKDLAYSYLGRNGDEQLRKMGYSDLAPYRKRDDEDMNAHMIRLLRQKGLYKAAKYREELFR